MHYYQNCNVKYLLRLLAVSFFKKSWCSWQLQITSTILMVLIVITLYICLGFGEKILPVHVLQTCSHKYSWHWTVYCVISWIFINYPWRVLHVFFQNVSMNYHNIMTVITIIIIIIIIIIITLIPWFTDWHWPGPCCKDHSQITSVWFK